MKDNNETGFGAANTSVLSGRDSVRRRPGMYFGTVKHISEHAVRELVANAIDRTSTGSVTLSLMARSSR